MSGNRTKPHGGTSMKRGHRKLWRAVADAAAKVATSTNYAEEYMYGIEFSRAMEALLEAGKQSHEEAQARV